MSAPEARLFLPVLRRLDRELQVPIPDRLRILRELAADLEALQARFVAEGCSPEDAEARALEMLVPTGPSVAFLEQLHAAPYQRLARGLGDERLRRAERTLLAGATAVLTAAQAWALFRTGFLSDASPFLWPVLATGALMSGALCVAAFQLWIRRDHAKAARGLRSLLVLSMVVPVLGFAGALMDFYRLAAVLAVRPDATRALLLGWLERDAGLVAFALLVALVGGLGWFVLSQCTTATTSAHAAFLSLPRGARHSPDHNKESIS